MTELNVALAIPLTRGEGGVFRITGTRVTLDSIVREFSKDNMGWSGWEKFRNLTPNDKTNLQQQK